MRSSKDIPDGDLSLSIEALKRKVLDAAVRGELTEQLAEDGTAKDLLIQISDEKRRLVAEGKIKKEKALPAISDEEIPFEIPENWEWVRLGDCLDVRDGTHDTPEYYQSGYPLVTSKNLCDGKIDFTNIKLISEKDFKKINERSFVESGDILFAMIGTIGNPVIVNKDREFAIKNVALFKIPIKEKIERKYLKFYLQYAEHNMNNQARGGLQPFVSLTYLRNYIFPLPPLAEQHRIVKRIDDAFHQLDELKKLQDAYSSNLDALRKKVIEEGIKGNLTERQRDDGTAAELLKEIEAEKQELIKTGKIKKEKPLPEITDEEKPFEIPESWEWVRFGDLCSLIHYGYTASASGCGNAHLLRITDIQDNTVCWNQIPYCTIDTDTAKKYVLNDNDILFTRTGGTVGKSYIVSGIPKDEIYVFASYLIRAIPTSRVNAKYLKKFMESSPYWSQVAENAIGSGQPNVNGESLKRIILPLPPLAEQRRIVKRIEEVLTLIE